MPPDITNDMDLNTTLDNNCNLPRRTSTAEFDEQSHPQHKKTTVLFFQDDSSCQDYIQNELRKTKEDLQQILQRRDLLTSQMMHQMQAIMMSSSSGQNNVNDVSNILQQHADRALELKELEVKRMVAQKRLENAQKLDQKRQTLMQFMAKPSFSPDYPKEVEPLLVQTSLQTLVLQHQLSSQQSREEGRLLAAEETVGKLQEVYLEQARRMHELEQRMEKFEQPPPPPQNPLLPTINAPVRYGSNASDLWDFPVQTQNTEDLLSESQQEIMFSHIQEELKVQNAHLQERLQHRHHHRFVPAYQRPPQPVTSDETENSTDTPTIQRERLAMQPFCNKPFPTPTPTPTPQQQQQKQIPSIQKTGDKPVSLENMILEDGKEKEETVLLDLERKKEGPLSLKVAATRSEFCEHKPTVKNGEKDKEEEGPFSLEVAVTRSDVYKQSSTSTTLAVAQDKDEEESYMPLKEAATCKSKNQPIRMSRADAFADAIKKLGPTLLVEEKKEQAVMEIHLPSVKVLPVDDDSVTDNEEIPPSHDALVEKSHSVVLLESRMLHHRGLSHIDVNKYCPSDDDISKEDCHEPELTDDELEIDYRNKKKTSTSCEQHKGDNKLETTTIETAAATTKQTKLDIDDQADSTKSETIKMEDTANGIPIKQKSKDRLDDDKEKAKAEKANYESMLKQQQQQQQEGKTKKEDSRRSSIWGNMQRPKNSLRNLFGSPTTPSPRSGGRRDRGARRGSRREKFEAAGLPLPLDDDSDDEASSPRKQPARPGAFSVPGMNTQELERSTSLIEGMIPEESDAFFVVAKAPPSHRTISEEAGPQSNFARAPSTNHLIEAFVVEEEDGERERLLREREEELERQRQAFLESQRGAAVGQAVVQAEVVSLSSSMSGPKETYQVDLDIDMELAASELGEGPMRFADRNKRSLHHQLHELSNSDLLCYQNLKDRWHSRRQRKPCFYLTDFMILRFARNACNRNGSFHEARAWKSMKNCKDRFLKLSAHSLEKQLLTKVRVYCFESLGRIKETDSPTQS